MVMFLFLVNMFFPAYHCVQATALLDDEETVYPISEDESDKEKSEVVNDEDTPEPKNDLPDVSGEEPNKAFPAQ